MRYDVCIIGSGAGGGGVAYYNTPKVKTILKKI